MAQTDQERQNSLVVLSIVLTSISTILVLVRLVIRICVILRPSYDDYTILVAQIFNIGCMIEILVAKANHVGFPAATLTINNMVSLLKVAVALEVTYHIIVGFTKISILCLYLRFAIAGINIITDVWILILPIKTLKGINRPLKEKIALVLIFGAGMFATAMSIVRLQSIYTYTLATDVFREAIAVNIWSIIEINAAILCSSVPALKPIFTPRSLQENRRKRRYHYRGRDDLSYGSYIHKTRSGRAGSNAKDHPDYFDPPTMSPDGRCEPGTHIGDHMDTYYRRGTPPPEAESDISLGLATQGAPDHM